MATKSKKNTRTKKQHTPDYFPVERSTPLGVDGGTLAGTTVGDCAKMLSIINRRLYRYGMLYRMKLDFDGSRSNTASFDVEVYALRNNWDTQRAFALAKKTYDAAYADELQSPGSEPARWRDFRVFHGVTSANELDPESTDNATLAETIDNVGEFVTSAVDVAGASKIFSWGVASSTRLDIKSEWIQAGQTNTEPASATTNAPYEGVNSDGMSDIEQTALGEHGNNPPYSTTSGSNMLKKVATLRFDPAPDGMQKLSTGFFDAPCGLFVLKTTTSGGNLDNGRVILTVQAGDYKGVNAHAMCQPMKGDGTY